MKSRDKIEAKFSTRANDHFKGRQHTKESKTLISLAKYNGSEKHIKKGYVMVYAPDHPHVHYGRVAEHRLIAEMAFGGSLPDGVVVHHINGVKTDNRPENLLVCTPKEHMTIHAKIRGFGTKIHYRAERDPITGRFISTK